MQFTGNKDADREILSKLEDKDLLQICSVNKYFKYIVCDDEFFKRRLMKYPDIEKYRGDKKWRRFFLETVYYISKLKEEFNYDYVFGNPKKQYSLFMNKNGGLFNEAARAGELSIIIYLLEKHKISVGEIDFAIKEAGIYNHFDIVDYLLPLTTTSPFRILQNAADYGRLSLVKYIVEKYRDFEGPIREVTFRGDERGKIIGNDFEIAKFGSLIDAAEYGYYDVVKYLLENGAKPNPLAIKFALQNGDFNEL